MRIESLGDLMRSPPKEYRFIEPLHDVQMTDYALEKAFRISKLVKKVHRQSVEWYGFMIADIEDPYLTIDVGLPQNATNAHAYTGITAQQIDAFQRGLPPDRIVNGWIHSHADLNYRQFSGTDLANHWTVLDYVGSVIKEAVSKREIRIDDLSRLVQDQLDERDMRQGSLSLVTDVPVDEVALFEQIMGSSAYAVVIGDEGWSCQEVIHKEYGLVTGATTYNRQSDIDEVGLVIEQSGVRMTWKEQRMLKKQVKHCIRPQYRGLMQRLGVSGYDRRKA